MTKMFRWLLTLLLGVYSMQTFAQEKTVSGTVLSYDDNTPLVSVTVTNRATGKKTSTNSAGYYSIAAKKGDKITFSYVGYANEDYYVGDDTKHNVKMQESDKKMEDVVVTAFGIKKPKRDMPNQIISVSGDEVAQTKRENFINGLAGRIPGATITATNGMPGASSSIILRGATSIDGSNQPIFVVDGLIIDNRTFEMQDRIPAATAGGVNLANRSNDYGNRAMDINPEDIETITIIKGAEATTLYGSDGANGAIVITTKKGSTGKGKLTYDNAFRFDLVNDNRLPQIQNVYAAGVNGQNDISVRSFFGARYPNGTQLFDNARGFFQNGFTQRHNVGFEGGNDIATYRLSFGSINQTGIVPNTGFNRYSVRLTSSVKLSPKLNIQTSFNYIKAVTDKAGATKGADGYLLSLLTWPHNDNAKDYLNPNGSRRIRGATFSGEADNPHFDANKNVNQDNNDRIMANGTISFDPAKWINFSATLGADFYSTANYWGFHPESRFGFITSGLYMETRERSSLLNGVFKATIRKKMGQVNNRLTVGFNFDAAKYNVNSVKGERFYEREFKGLNNVDPITTAQQTTIENYNRFGAFASYDANYKNWLNFNLAGRMDASSRLARTIGIANSDPYYFFGSTGLSFIFSDVLAKKPKWLEFGKLRASLSTTGRDPYRPYLLGDRFVQSTFTGGGFQLGVVGGNPYLRPEFTRDIEFGTELKLFKGRLGFDVAVYERRTKDQILAPRTSYGTGFILVNINGGEVQNRGVEVQMTVNPVKTKKFNWDVTVNFDRNVGKVTRMPADLPSFYNSDTWMFGNVRNITAQGTFTTALGSSRYLKNTNGDVIISPTSGLPIRDGNFYVTGDRNPLYKIAFINTFTFNNNWNLSFNLDCRRGGDVYNATELFLYSRGMSVKTLDRETPRVIKGVLADGLQNTSTPTPNNIVVTPFTRQEYYTSQFSEEEFIEKDINWIRLRDITLGYRVPSSFIKKQKLIKAASVFVTATDLFIITNYSGVDPSSNGNNTSTRAGFGGIGFDFGNLATPVGINFGIKLQF